MSLYSWEQSSEGGVSELKGELAKTSSSLKKKKFWSSNDIRPEEETGIFIKFFVYYLHSELDARPLKHEQGRPKM